MKILMMTNTYTPIVGGLEKSIMTFTDALRARNHKVIVVAPEFDDSPKKEKGVIRLPAIKNFGRTKFSVNLPIPGVLPDLIESFQPDIIHAHHPFLVGSLALRMAEQFDIPIVFTYHTMFEWYSDFGLDHPGVEAFVLKLASGYSKLVDHIIVPSESVRKVLVSRKIKTPISVVPTGMDNVKFKEGNGKKMRSALKIPQKAFVVGHLGRLEPEKNLEFLTKTVAEFLKREKKAHFLLVGKGQLKKTIKAILKKEGVFDRFHYPGVLKGQNLIDAYHAMSVFTFASKSETQGMVVTEAMAAGLPVVAIDAPGVREVVRNFKNGRLLKNPSQAKMLNALLWCAKRTPERWQKLKDEAMKTAEEFSIEKSTAKALEVYEALIKLTNLKEKRKDFLDSLMRRMQIEWEMLENFGNATGESLKSTIKSTTKKLVSNIGHAFSGKKETVKK